MTHTDVMIIGAGPIGLETAIGLQRAGVEYVQIDAGQIGQTIMNWPAGTKFLSAPEDIAIAGVPIPSIDQDRVPRELYLAYLRSVAVQFRLAVRTYERVVSVVPVGGQFEIRTESRGGPREYRSRRIVLATGDMSCPARMGVPGEDRLHVHHELRDVHTYFGQKVLVVGGRNSAMEAAIRCVRAHADVTLAFRDAEVRLDLVSHKIGPLVEEMGEKGRIRLLPGVQPVAIGEREATLGRCTPGGEPLEGGERIVAADFVLAMIGYQCDTRLYEMLGVEIGPQGRPVYDEATMHTRTPGVYLAGTATAGPEAGHRMFIETGHVHVRRIIADLAGHRA